MITLNCQETVIVMKTGFQLSFFCIVFVFCICIFVGKVISSQVPQPTQEQSQIFNFNTEQISQTKFYPKKGA